MLMSASALVLVFRLVWEYSSALQAAWASLWESSAQQKPVMYQLALALTWTEIAYLQPVLLQHRWRERLVQTMSSRPLLYGDPAHPTIPQISFLELASSTWYPHFR